MWKLEIATYAIKDNRHAETHRSEELTFPTRFDAEIYVSDIVWANTNSNTKFLGFITSPWGDHHTCDPSLIFWQNDFLTSY